MKVLLLFYFAVLTCTAFAYGRFGRSDKEKCNRFVSFIRFYKDSLKNTSSIKNFAGFFCRMFKVDCDLYGRSVQLVLTLSKSRFKPYMICRVIPRNIKKLEIKKIGNKSLECIACNTIVGVINYNIKVLNKSVDDVKEGIETLCKLIAPLKVQVKVCNAVTDEITQIIQWVLSGLSPRDMCIRLKMCTQAAKDKNRVLQKFNNKIMRPFRTNYFQQYRPFVQENETFRERITVRQMRHRTRPSRHRIRHFEYEFKPFREKTRLLKHGVNPFTRGIRPFKPYRGLSLRYLKLHDNLTRHQPHHRGHQSHHHGHHGRHPHHHGYYPHHHGHHPHHHGHHPHHHGNHSRHHGHHGHHHHRGHHYRNNGMETTEKPMGTMTPEPEVIELLSEEEENHMVNGSENYSKDEDSMKSGFEFPETATNEYYVDIKRPAYDESMFDRKMSHWFGKDGPGSRDDNITDDNDDGDDDDDNGDDDDNDDDDDNGDDDDNDNDDDDDEDDEGKNEKDNKDKGDGFFYSLIKKIPPLFSSDYKKFKMLTLGLPKFKIPKQFGGDYKKIMPKFRSKEQKQNLLGGDYEKIMSKDKLPSIEIPKMSDFLKEFYIPSFGKGLFGDAMNNVMKKAQEVEMNVKKGLSGFSIFKPNPEFFSTDIFEELEAQMKKLAEDIKKNMTSLITDKATPCTLCKTVVKLVEWEVHTVNVSVKYIEKAVKAMCQLYPVRESTEECLKIVNKVGEVVKMIEKDVEPADICERLNLCNTTNVSTILIPVDSKTFKCTPLCKLMKGVHEESILKTNVLLGEVGKQLTKFCKKNGIVSKCDDLFYSLNKTGRQLEAFLAHTVLSEEEEGEGCKCFRRQPVLYLKKSDKCQLCKQLEKGMSNDLKFAEKIPMILANKLEEICDVLPNAGNECTEIVAKFRISFIHLEKKLEPTGVCSAIGFCQNNSNTIERITRRIAMKIRKGFSGGKFRALSQFSFECKFCESCMENLVETFKRTNSTDTEEIIPAVKDGLNIFCETEGDGETSTSVCKTISDGMEKVHKFITKKKDAKSVCKMIGVC